MTRLVTTLVFRLVFLFHLICEQCRRNGAPIFSKKFACGGGGGGGGRENNFLNYIH